MNKKSPSKTKTMCGSSRGRKRRRAMGKAYKTKNDSKTKILESIIDAINRPESRLENAEWYHLEEY